MTRVVQNGLASKKKNQIKKSSMNRTNNLRSRQDTQMNGREENNFGLGLYLWLQEY